MANRERYQVPVIGDNLTLRLLVYNQNQFASVYAIDRVEIWKLDDCNPKDVSARRLIKTINGSDVTQDDIGKYHVSVDLEDRLFLIGKYVDVWYLSFEQFESDEDHIAPVENEFEIYRDLWFTSPVPIIYDFTFSFRPNKLMQGSKQYLIVNVKPNVPTASTLEAYYENLASISPIYISIAKRCGECIPAEEDLRLVVDRELVEVREYLYGYYLLDTSDLDPGIYDVWFELQVTENVYISPKGQLQIFK